MAAYVLEINVGIRGIVNGAIDARNVVALLSKIDEACVCVDNGTGGESCGQNMEMVNIAIPGEWQQCDSDSSMCSNIC